MSESHTYKAIQEQNFNIKVLIKPPGWILKWGITAVFVSAILFTIIAWFIRYPEIVYAQTMLNSEFPAVRVFTKAGGKINKLFVSDQQYVKQNEVLALIDNNAVLEDIIKLESFLRQMEDLVTLNDFAALPPTVPHNLILGQIQNDYTLLIQKIELAHYLLSKNGLAERVKTIRSHIDQLKKINSGVDIQKTLLNKEISLLNKNYERNQLLNSFGNVSDIDLEKLEAQIIQHQRQMETINNAQNLNDLEVEKFKSEIVDLELNFNERSAQITLEIKELVRKILGQIEDWRHLFLISAPISGILSFQGGWTEQQFVREQENIFAVVPVGDTLRKKIGRAILPASNSGKVKPGQRVFIRLNAFPYQEWGVIQGVVKSISLLPQGNNYIAEINLPDNFVTTYKREIPFSHEMQGTALIVTEEKRLISQLLSHFVIQ